MSPETITTAVAAVAIIGFLWSLHRDIRALDWRVSDLAERLARLEGAMEVLTRFLIDREHGRTGHRSKCGNSSLHTRVGPVPRHAVLGVGGCPNDARARQRPWISAVSARADSRAA